MSGTVLSEDAANVANWLQRPALSPVWLAFIVICLDLPVFGIAVWFVQYSIVPAMDFHPSTAMLRGVMAALAAVATLVLSQSYGPNVLRKGWQGALRAFFSLIGPVVLLVSVQPGIDIIGFLFVTTLLLVCFVSPMRLVEARIVDWIMHTGLIQRRAIVAGGGYHADRLIRGLAAQQESDVRIYGIFDDRDDKRSPPQVLGIPKLGGYDALVEFVRVAEIDLVIISLPLEAEERIDWLLASLKVLPVEVRLSAFSDDYQFTPMTRDPLIMAIQGSFAPERRFVKRAFDILTASLALLIFWPLMVLTAIAIRIETKGPVIFRQKRHGYNDRVFEVLKFRSMYIETMDPTARRIVTRDDPRVTRIGRIIRASSIDELPQLFNVLTGSLSMVGPRPHAVNAVSSRQERFSNIVDNYSARHRLPPGITGWAQINGHRGEVDIPEKLHARLEHDLHYIENWSIWLDIKILIRTPISLINNRAAY